MLLKLNRVGLLYQEYGAEEVLALDGIDLEIRRGEFIGIIGRTGSGKSSLIELMAGLIEPSSGTVELEGRDIFSPGFSEEVLRKNLGIVFQNPDYQIFERSVEREVAFGLKYQDLDGDEKNQRVRWALEKMTFDYRRVASLSPLSFSGGERKKIALAGILALKPSTIIFDEPLAGLDYTSRKAFLKLIWELNSEGYTIIMVTHDLESISEYASRLLVLSSGRLVGDGPTREILNDSKLMEKSGLGLTRVQSLSLKLRQRGFFTDENPLDKRELLDLIEEKLLGGRK